MTKDKLEILRDADAIFREELAEAGLSRKVHQYFAVLTNNRSVGVMGDFRTYDYTLALRGVTYKPIGASALLRRNLFIYGLGGVIVPFVGIKLIDMLVSVFF